MNALTLARMGVRIAGAIQVLLGLAIWLGADPIVPLHMLIGIVFVVALWSVAFLAWRSGAAPSLVVLAAIVGLALPIVGVTQDELLAGSAHWVVQVLHLGLGVVGIGLGEMLGVQAERREPAR